MKGWEREYDELDRRFDAGELSVSEHTEEIQALDRALRACYEEDLDRAEQEVRERYFRGYAQ